VKNNEKAQEKFVNGYYRTCVTNYERKYAVYRDKLKGVDRTVTNEFLLPCVKLSKETNYIEFL